MEDIEIYKAKPGDEKILAYIQAESWKAAFAEILTAQELKRCTDLEKCKEMYQKVLEHSEISIWIEKVDKNRIALQHGVIIEINLVKMWPSLSVFIV